jgi:small subunit ribosomal protein S15
MARLHTRGRGSSRSTPPVRTSTPDWVPYSAEEIEEIILRLHGEGMSKSRIGATLRDQYGIPDVGLIMGKKLTDVLRDNDIQEDFPEDFLQLMRKAVNLRDHIKRNSSDTEAKTDLNLVESKIRRLQKYYWRKGKIPRDWRYDPEKAALLVG